MDGRQAPTGSPLGTTERAAAVALFLRLLPPVPRPVRMVPAWASWLEIAESRDDARPSVSHEPAISSRSRPQDNRNRSPDCTKAPCSLLGDTSTFFNLPPIGTPPHVSPEAVSACACGGSCTARNRQAGRADLRKLRRRQRSAIPPADVRRDNALYAQRCRQVHIRGSASANLASLPAHIRGSGSHGPNTYSDCAGTLPGEPATTAAAGLLLWDPN
jgi:hypothetical protein